MDISFTIPDFWFGVLVTVISVPIICYFGAILIVMLVWRRG
ncbi:gp149.1 [Bacillus phage W.Ph.]|uniref:Gp149.1 n=1 Tax=Bacillus phage W.Ph. TaxID=764595 RepID=L7UXP2_9CAUD|nr:gp149.1 [Bacillus phage W.Ph.]AGC55706.1 gp149.1 [Bacillus phage W.Ph.]